MLNILMYYLFAYISFCPFKCCCVVAMDIEFSSLILVCYVVAFCILVFCGVLLKRMKWPGNKQFLTRFSRFHIGIKIYLKTKWRIATQFNQRSKENYDNLSLQLCKSETLTFDWNFCNSFLCRFPKILRHWFWIIRKEENKAIVLLNHTL